MTIFAKFIAIVFYSLVFIGFPVTAYKMWKEFR